MQSTGGQLVYAIGDIHGRYDLLIKLLGRIRPDVDGKARGRRPIFVFCGDHVDRGPDSARVIQALSLLSNRVDLEVHALKGNHEAMLLSFIEHPDQGRNWLRTGGAATLTSYGIEPPTIDEPDIALVKARDQLLSAMPAAHIVLLNNMKTIMTIGDFVFVHAGLDPTLSITKQNSHDPLWIGAEFRKHRRSFGKTVIHGHSWLSDKPDIRSNRIGIDTGAYETGVLTCLCLDADKQLFLQTRSEAGARSLIASEVHKMTRLSTGPAPEVGRSLAGTMDAVGDDICDIFQALISPEAFGRYFGPRMRNIPAVTARDEKRSAIIILAIILIVAVTIALLATSLSGQIHRLLKEHGIADRISTPPSVALKNAISAFALGRRDDLVS